jgi:MoaA/NifB/PqqE/SkfB family radical SAM enzyme
MKQLFKHIRVFSSLLKRRPILLVFDVTRLCNQRCLMCNIWREKSEDLDALEIKKMAELLRAEGLGYVFLQGGEPTLRQDLIQIVDIFIEAGIKPTVITNGLLMRGDLPGRLAARPCNVTFSLDTLKPEIFKTLRGLDGLDTVTANIRAASQIKPRSGHWAVRATVTSLSTLSDIQALEAFSAECGFMFAAGPYTYVAGTAGRPDDRLAFSDSARILEIVYYLRDKARKTNYLASLVYDGHISYLKGEPPPRCDALTRSMVMSPKGEFAPCLEFTGESAPLEILKAGRGNWLRRCAECNEKTPCICNDAREIGLLWRRKWRILLHGPQIAAQLFRYGNFF